MTIANSYHIIVFFLSIPLFFNCEKNKPLFVNVSSNHSNILFSNRLIENDQISILDYLYYYNGGGVAIGDINNDGLQDIFFTGNQIQNKLYLNQGNLQFKDISSTAGIQGNGDWSTGVTMVDINGDGYLDIYVCNVVGPLGFEGYNELYINQKNETFKEKSHDYGLNIESYSVMAIFFDFDLDGDLDMYLLNQALHSENNYLKKIDKRADRNYETGDKLLENKDEKFVDISEKAGIYGSSIGYGLGVKVEDFNQDGYPDVFVSNDFQEDDYLYINNQDGTFKESLRNKIAHTSRFSMGCDSFDINNDGYPDIFSADMLAADEVILKKSAGDETFSKMYLRVEKLGFYYQYTRNMLQINQHGNFFVETALMSNVAASDWSWSPIFADYNNDGLGDLFISNGIPKRPNDLDYIKYISNQEIKKQLNYTKLLDQKVLDKMPDGLSQNNLFLNQTGWIFENVSKNSLPNRKTCTNGVGVSDLDNDGDLDIVLNNLNDFANILENRSSRDKNFLRIQLQYVSKNIFGIGTKVKLFTNNQIQHRSLNPVKGFQSTSEQIIHFGLNKAKKVDSIQVIWPNHEIQIVKNIKINQLLSIKYTGTSKNNFKPALTLPIEPVLFQKTENNLGIEYTHIEDPYIDFDWNRLLPYKITDKGPEVTIGDFNHDDKEDIIFSSSKFEKPVIYFQTELGYRKKIIDDCSEQNETIDLILEDFNNDAKKELIMVSGGQTYYQKKNELSNYVLNYTQNKITINSITDLKINASVVKSLDIDNDGDLDLLIGGYTEFTKFGSTYPSYIFMNNEGDFISRKLELDIDYQLITDASPIHLNNDGYIDLVMVGEWGSPIFLINQQGKLVNKTEDFLKQKLNGLWQFVYPFDIDKDGDKDLILGNYGLNTKFKASQEFPMIAYIGDLDNNGSDTFINTIEKKGKYYPIESLDQLHAQSLYFKRKFRSYHDFAGKSIQQLISQTKIDEMKKIEVHTLLSGYLQNNDNQYTFIPFQKEFQVSPLTAVVSFDFDLDNEKELLFAGNYFGLPPFHGRQDGFSGILLDAVNKFHKTYLNGLNLFNKSVRSLDIFNFNNHNYLLVTINNEKAEIYKIN